MALRDLPAYSSVEVTEWIPGISNRTPRLWTLSSGGTWFCAAGTVTEMFDERDLDPLIVSYILRSKPVQEN